MSEPLKDFRPAIRPHTHRVLSRIARARGVSLQELGREVIEEFIRNAIHDAKVVLGIDEGHAHQAESRGTDTEDDGTRRRAGR